jgi:hypothetical protein
LWRRCFVLGQPIVSHAVQKQGHASPPSQREDVCVGAGRLREKTHPPQWIINVTGGLEQPAV